MKRTLERELRSHNIDTLKYPTTSFSTITTTAFFIILDTVVVSTVNYISLVLANA